MRANIIASALCALLVTGCAGGGHTGASSSVLPAAPTAPTSSARSFALLVPNAVAVTATAANRRSVKYVSPSTLSGSVQFYAGAPFAPIGSPMIVDLSPSSSACSPVTGGRSCVITFPAGITPGTVGSIWISLYDAANATGNLLSQGGIVGAEWVVAAGASNALVVDLGGVPASFALVQGAPLAPGASTVALTFFAYDADGHPIAEPAAAPTVAGAIITSEGSPLLQTTVSTVAQESEISFNIATANGVALAGGTSSTNGVCASNPFGVQTLTSPCPLTITTSLGSFVAPTPVEVNAPTITHTAAGTNVNVLALPNGNATGGYETQMFVIVADPAAGPIFASSTAAPQTVTVTPPGGFTGPVTLAASYCLSNAATSQFTANGSFPVPLTSNGTAVGNVVNIGPPSGISTLGSPVSFTLAPVGAGECVVTDSQGGTRTVVVAW
jgi:hypothetical protein